MLSMPLRKQGGATIVTIPPAVLKHLHWNLGDVVQMQVQEEEGKLVLAPQKPRRRQRLRLDELLAGVTPAVARAMLRDIAWARAGSAVGREIA